MSAIAQLVRRARRRRQIHVVLQRAAVACAIGLGTSVLFLITGSALVPGAWFWPLLLFAASFIVLSSRRRAAAPSDYVITQQIDRRLALHDSLSTALYFEQNPEESQSAPEIVAWQRDRAEQQARSADLSRAVPFIAPRSLYVSGCLAIMAAGLFAARYGITRSLDLRASLVHLAFQGEQAHIATGETAASAAAANHAVHGKEGIPLEASLPVPVSEADAAASNALLDSLQPAQPQAGENAPGQMQSSSGDAQGGNAGQDGLSGPQSESAPVADGPQRLSEGAPGKPASANGSSSQNGAQQSGGDQEHSSLLDRMRDAMAGLLSKLTTPQNSGENKSSPSQSGSRGAGVNHNTAPGTSAAGKAQGNPANGAGRPDPTAAVAQAAKASQASDQQSAADSADSPAGKSGIGRQDGRKDPRLAEQLQAMGKISEIIGRRSRTVTGDVVVEVSSGTEQQLKTAYSGKSAAHNDTTGEMSRDEVPLIYQDYIANYFDQIRKLPAPRATESH